ncbi:MAG: DUF3644 domain-containing protein, partial [Nitrobacter sp.]
MNDGTQTMASRASLGSWEVALVKAFLQFTEMNNQDILPYFSRPGRSINHRVIEEIRSGTHFSDIDPASEEQLRDFRERWFTYSIKIGKQKEIEEHVLKAREAQISAIQIFNNPAISFRAENCIVLSIIAWTYLFHAYFRKIGVDYRYYRYVEGQKAVELTPEGLERYWDLSKCLESEKCRLSTAIKENLKFLITVRNMVSHRLTGNIDLRIASKLQAAALNFNTWLIEEFGGEHRIDSDFGVAIQMSSLSHDHATLLYSSQNVDPKIASSIDDLDRALPDAVFRDTKYAFNILFVEQSCNRANQADKVVQFVRAGTEPAEAIERVIFKERERSKYKPKQVVTEMRKRDFLWFNMAVHTKLWHELDAKNPKNGYGVQLSDGQWYYYES